MHKIFNIQFMRSSFSGVKFEIDDQIFILESKNRGGFQWATVYNNDMWINMCLRLNLWEKWDRYSCS